MGTKQTSPNDKFEEFTEELIEVLQSCHLNFLIGAGLSAPYLGVLGSIEKRLSRLENNKKLAPKEKDKKRCDLYEEYFDEVIGKNIEILKDKSDDKLNDTMSGYEDLLKNINLILLERKSTILHKQANLFTTNIDIFIEKAMEKLSIDYNSGFSGDFELKFSSGNFKKIYFKRSFHYEKLSEMPLLNLLKIHGSLTWSKKKKDIVLDRDLDATKEVKKVLDKIKKMRMGAGVDAKHEEAMRKKFINNFEKLPIVLPTKNKLNRTLIDDTYYDLLRIYANELEKTNSVLFVMGFSFSDEHIKTITKRAIDSNPTLIVYIFPHKKKTIVKLKDEIGKDSKLNNVKYVPHNKEYKEYDLQNIADFFESLLDKTVGKSKNHNSKQKNG